MAIRGMRLLTSHPLRGTLALSTAEVMVP